MRAGLLSQPEVIQKLNERFVCTTMTYFDVYQLSKKGDEFAKKIVPNWSNPVSLMFFTPDGDFVLRLNPVKDFTDVHPDTDLRPGQRYDANPQENVRKFFEQVDKHFVKAP